MRSRSYRWAYDVSHSMNYVASMLRETDYPDFKTVDRLIYQASSSLSKLRRAVRNKKYRCRLTTKTGI